MSRTADQLGADHLLTQAIEQVMRAYGFEQEFVLGDYAVIGARSTIKSDGEIDSGEFVLMRDSTLPRYRLRGLLTQAVADLDHGVYDAEDDVG